MFKKKPWIVGMLIALFMFINTTAFAAEELAQQLIKAQSSTPYVILIIIAQIIIIYILTQTNLSKKTKKYIHITAALATVVFLAVWISSIVSSNPIPTKEQIAQDPSASIKLSNNLIEEQAGPETEIGFLNVEGVDPLSLMFELAEYKKGQNNNDVFGIDFASDNANRLMASYNFNYEIASKLKVEVKASDANDPEKVYTSVITVHVKPLVMFDENGGLNGAYFSKNMTIVIMIVLFLILYVLAILDFSKRTKDVVRLVMSYTLLVILLILSIYPILFIIMTSIRTENTLSSLNFLPLDENGSWNGTLQHYKDLFVGQHSEYLTWFMNTLKVSTLSMIFGTILTILASYALSRFKFRGRNTSLTLLLILGMFPGFMAMIAIYIFLQEMQLHDTHLALILVYSLGAPLGGVFVAKGFYDTIPKSLEEAARIDGASQLGIFIRIVLPLSKPMLTFIALTIFTGTWVDFIFAKIIIFSDEKMTLAVGLLQLAPGAMNESFYNAFAAGSVLAAIPITLLFIFLQRFLVEGLTAGASKG